MADVLLVFPRTRWDILGVTTRLPLALLYVGSYLKSHGFSVQIVDQRADPAWRQTLRRAAETPPLWTGISCMTGEQIQNGLAAAQILRQANAKVPVVWGGVHPSLLPREVLAHPLADMVAVGEGEATALELAQRLREDGPNADLTGVRGLVFERGPDIVDNQPREALDMNALPAMDYSLVTMQNYVLRELAGERSLQMTTSRGCPMNCGYCYLGSVPCGRKYRAESPERTVQAIQDLVERFDVNAIHIIDDEFFIQVKRARRVCELLLERGVRVQLRANCRIDALDRMETEMLELLRRAGFSHLYLGVEAGNDRVLKFIKKGITREQVLRVNRKLAEAGIAPKYSFMAGFPTETSSEIKDTLRLMLRLVGENPRAQTTPVQLYTPYPGTPLYDYCREIGAKLPTEFEGWADWGWEQCQSEWLAPDEKAFLRKAAYFTFFLDGKTVSDSLSSPFMRMLARVYGFYVRERIRRDSYGFMPEIGLIRRKLSE